MINSILAIRSFINNLTNNSNSLNLKLNKKLKNLEKRDKIEIMAIKSDCDVFILGTGIAGLIAAWQHRKYKVIIIGDKLGGQMASEVMLGPRIIQKDENTFSLLKELGFKDFSTSKAKILYNYNSEIYEKAPKGFREKYSQISRGSFSVAEHTMSEGKNEIEYFNLPYNKLVNRLIIELKKLPNIKIIEDKIIKINTNAIITETETYIIPEGCFKINTIMLPIFLNLIDADEDLRSKICTKSTMVNFYRNKNINNKDINIINPISFEKYNTNLVYVYFVNDNINQNNKIPYPYLRVTYIPDNIIYESIFRLESDPNYKDIFKDKIEYLTTIPKIVNNDLPFLIIKNWNQFGRFAEWDQSIKLNELLKNKKKRNGYIIN